jgi:hypothetical protein
MGIKSLDMTPRFVAIATGIQTSSRMLATHSIICGEVSGVKKGSLLSSTHLAGAGQRHNHLRQADHDSKPQA